jgi:hypothetical protein
MIAPPRREGGRPNGASAAGARLHALATRRRVGFAALFVLGSAGCGWISGLSGYEEAAGAMDGSESHPTQDASLAEQDSGGARKDTQAPRGSAASDDSAPGEDGTSSGQEGAGSETSDGSVASDAGSLADAAPGAMLTCGPMTCANCCIGGLCVGGKSVTTCGTSGQDCKDCTNMGGACGSDGSCVTRVADAGPPPACDPAKCGGCGFYTRGCCKSDLTCGCIIDYVVASSACL